MSEEREKDDADSESGEDGEKGTVRSFSVEEVAGAMAAIERRKTVGYWPPLRLRGTVKPCMSHGDLHYHCEAVALLGGGVVAHIYDPEPYPGELAAAAVLDQMARQMGVPDWNYQKHEDFEHSGEPEMAAQAALDEDRTRQSAGED